MSFWGKKMTAVKTQTLHPFFSIIVPVYNSSQTLERCLESVLKQDFQNYEVICVDDGSNDSSWSMLEEYVSRDSRLRRFAQTNSGPAAARNKGLQEALGDYVLFLDSDDYLYVADALSIISGTIASNDGCEIVYFAGAFESSDGVFPDQSKQSKIYDFGYQCMEDNCLNSKGIVFGSVYVQCCKKSVLDAHSIRFNEHLFYGEDRLFVCTLFHYANKTVEIPDVLYCYVVNNSMSLMRDVKRRSRLQSDNLQVVKQLDSLLQKKEHKQPKLRKYVHGLYVQGLDGMTNNEIDWSLIFRNASTIKLWVKDILLYLGLFHY
jgi:glycosyltransferase EpsJ